MQIQSKASLSALFLAGATSLAAAGGSSYEYIDLGTLGGPASAAFGLNDARQVVGWAHIDNCLVDGAPCRRAFLWHDGSMVDLGLLAGDEGSFARAINNGGLVVGTSELDVVAASGTFRGTVWDGGAIAQLPDFGDGRSFAHDVNDAGTIVGHAVDQTVIRDRAVSWTGGSIHNLGDTEEHSYNRAFGVNESGQVAGWAWNLFQPNDAIVYDGAWFTVGGIDGPFQNAEASDINDSGVMVGLQAFPSGDWHAAIWSFGNPTIDAGTLPGLAYGELYDVNEAGVAVGRSYAGTIPEVSRAVIWENGELKDLNDLLPAEVDAVLWEAREINENGDIAATAVVDGFFRAVLLARTDAEATWEPLGHAMAGDGGTPTLIGEGDLAPGAPITVRVKNALPGASAWLVLGFNEIDLPLFLGTLVPTPDITVGPLAIDGNGEHTLAANWPAGLPAGFSTWWQTWIFDTSGPADWAATNGLRRVTE